MDAVERDTLLAAGLPEFRKIRAHGYRVLLLQEIEEDGAVGLMDPRRILPITSREVRAGRLSPTDDLHRLALRGADPAKKAGSLLAWRYELEQSERVTGSEATDACLTAT